MNNNCDHKFIDSNSCLKCGWTPTEDELHIKPPLPTPRTDALTELLSHSHGKSDGACFSEMKLLARELERELAESDEEIVRLTELNAFIANGSFKASEVMAKENSHLRFENERLKRGEFTKEEFQNLCHNRHEKEGCTAKDFFDGCAAYQASLFGESDRSRSRLDGLRYALGVVKGRRILNRPPAYLAAVDEMEIFLEAAIDRVERGEQMSAVAIVQTKTPPE